eukprot:1148351-Pelagomonas_calceolata.AAC.3
MAPGLVGIWRVARGIWLQNLAVNFTSNLKFLFVFSSAPSGNKFVGVLYRMIEFTCKLASLVVVEA